MKKSVKNFINLFWPYVLVIVLIILPLFIKSGYLFFTDISWGPNINLDWHRPYFLFNSIVNALSFVLPIDLLEKIFITTTLILILLGGRILIKTILEYCNNSKDIIISRGLIFVLSLFALFNPFVYDRALYGQFGILIAYGCLFFVITYLFKTWQALDFKKLYPVAIFSVIALMFSAHFIFLMLPFYLLFLIGIFLKRQEIKTVGLFRKFKFSLLFSIVIVLVINANWLTAIFINSSPLNDFFQKEVTSQDLIAFSTAGKTPTETITNVLMMSGFWGKDQFRYLDLTDISGWQRSFILLLPIILYGVYLSFRKNSRQNKIFIFSLLIIFIAAILLAVGIKAPIARSLTLFFYDHLPFYKGLREPQKWVAVIIPIYLFYLTLGVIGLNRLKIIIKNRFLGGVILTAIIVMLAPSLLWGFNRQVKPTPYPDDWYEVNNLLISKFSKTKDCSDRILFLPWHMYLKFNWAGKVIANPSSNFFKCPIISGTNMEWGGIYDNSGNFNSEAIVNWLKLKGDEGMPTLVGDRVRYIILAKEVDFKDYLWLNKAPYLQLIKETETLFVYEVRY